MFAALPPIAGSTPITTPMNEVQSSRNGRERISQITLKCDTARLVIFGAASPGGRAAAHLLDVAHDLREREHADQHRQERNAAFDEVGRRA